MPPAIVKKIDEFKKTAGKCVECRTFDLLHHDEQNGWAYPLFDEFSSCSSGIVVVSEAPNFDDTFNESKRRLTYDIQTDDTGNFTRELLESVGLKVSDVLFTNSVLCLPALNKDGKYKVSAKQSNVGWAERNEAHHSLFIPDASGKANIAEAAQSF